MNQRILVSGSNSGLGKYLTMSLNGATGLNRNNAAKLMDGKIDFDIIIHCAFNTKRNIPYENIYQYYCDNLKLTENLLKLKYKHFVYISSIDVYHSDNILHTETERLAITPDNSQYSCLKLINEAMVTTNDKNAIILRPSLMLGKFSRPNSVSKILLEEEPEIRLAPSSSFNIILHSDVELFIKASIEKKLTGIYNLTSSHNITLEEVAEYAGKSVKYGKYEYKAGHVSNQKAIEFYKGFDRKPTSNIEIFLNEK